MAVRVKVCGITNTADALAVVDAGADAIGFVFAASPRQVTLEAARAIAAEVPPLVCKVGVFVDASLEYVRQALAYCGLDLAQLHGSESPELCRALLPRVVKSFRVKDDSVLQELARYKVNAYLLDTYDVLVQGGSGRSFDWRIARNAGRLGRIILSGGLRPENVQVAVRLAQPYAVDVCSGVESRPGKKDHGKVSAFVAAVREAVSGTGVT